MALTEEQIKNLKPGDPVIIHGTFWDNSTQGDIIVTCPTMYAGEVVQDRKYIHPTCCYLPSGDLKHDPCRKFKKGDIVRVVEKAGRLPAFLKAIVPGNIYKVNSNEDKNYQEVLLDTGIAGGELINWYYLELITPIDGTLPYYMVEKDIEFQIRMRAEGEDCLISTFRFKNIVEGYKRYYDMLPSMRQAREAAEAELNRLNEEYSDREK